ncbi:MAG: ankyrin repeat domain-containing protein [Candidatus Poribacteria bacterium]|nr:ankyrin repeat domain-containing protein [Candidatus Poribacteria bacterium]
MQRIQEHLQTLNRLLVLVVMCCLFLSISPTAQGFFATTTKELGLLLKRIDKPQWRIGYNFTADCPAVFREKEAELKEAIEKALQAWLHPLRVRYVDREFTDDFVLVRLPDFAECGEDVRVLRELDTRITFDCKGVGLPFAAISLGFAPDLCIKTIEEAGAHQVSNYALVHELGHAFGLEDTYIHDHLVSSGGLAHTVDKQPAAIMAGGFLRRFIALPFALGEDDKNGIIWLYKYLHEDHSAGDCFFSDYVPKGNGRCEPKYPLIFEAKHGAFETVRQILIDDPALDLNARDAQGMTALHYAVQRGSAEMVKALLAQATIKVNLLNKDKRTPAQLARELQQVNLAKMIEAHPTANQHPVAWSVSSEWRLTATWGALKRVR